MFDLDHRALGQYDWTGDRRWIDDPDLAAYYLRSVEDFVAAHDSDGDGLPEAPGTGDIFDGAASYNEHPERPLTVAADGLATQYAALNAVAQATTARRTGLWLSSIQERFASWWDEETGSFARGRDKDQRLDFGWGLETSWFVPMLGLSGTGERNERFLDFIEAQLELSPPPNIEAFSYLPEVFFRHGRDESAWRWLEHTHRQP